MIDHQRSIEKDLFIKQVEIEQHAVSLAQSHGRYVRSFFFLFFPSFFLYLFHIIFYSISTFMFILLIEDFVSHRCFVVPVLLLS